MQPTSAPRIALFGFADVFEDFYPHFGVDQEGFASRWDASGTHSFAALLHERVGPVTWYELSLAPEVQEAVHDLGFRVRFVRSSLLHRNLWQAFYGTKHSWRMRRAYRAYATVASPTAPFSRELLRSLRADRPDVLFVQDYSTGRFDALMAIARVLKVPLIAYHSGSTFDSYTGVAFRKRTLPRADALLLSSERERDAVVRRFGIDPARCHVVLTPIDLTLFAPTAQRPAESDRSFLFVGRLDDQVKRVSALIDAFARAIGDRDDVVLTIVGAGPDEARLRALGEARLGQKARFIGWQDGSALRSLYTAADVLVLPSKREGFPTVVGEALACGTPVIASDVGGISELVHDGVTGRLIAAGDDEALEQALRDAVDDRQKLIEMRPAAREMAERRVALDVVATQVRDIVDGVLTRGRR